MEFSRGQGYANPCRGESPVPTEAGQYFVGELDWGFSVWAHNACVRHAKGTYGTDSTVDAATFEIQSAVSRAEIILKSGGTGNTKWGSIYQRYAGTGTWRERVSYGNAIQQVTDSLLQNNTVLDSAKVIFNRGNPIGIRSARTGTLLRPDYHLPLVNGGFAVFDISSLSQASKIWKYNVNALYLVNILY
jgi:hypothetical protein